MIDEMGAFHEKLDRSDSPGANGLLHRPISVPEVGIRQTGLEDLALKILYLSGPFSVLDLSKHMRLSLEVADELFRRLRTGQLCEVTGMHGNVANIAITSQGRVRALNSSR